MSEIVKFTMNNDLKIKEIHHGLGQVEGKACRTDSGLDAQTTHRPPVAQCTDHALGSAQPVLVKGPQKGVSQGQCVRAMA